MLKMHQKPKPQLRESGSEFSFEYPKFGPNSPKVLLVSVLKKKITQAVLKSQERKETHGEDDFLYQDLRIAVAFAAQKLKLVIDRKFEPILEWEELYKGIRALDLAMRKC